MSDVKTVIESLSDDDVDKMYVIRYGTGLLANEGAFVSFITKLNVIIWPESALSISKLNANLIQNLFKTKKIFTFNLSKVPPNFRKTFLGFPVSSDVKAGIYSIDAFENILFNADVKLIIEIGAIEDVI